ncbi:glutaredoxin family protein [Thiohalocapsa marina]|nr:glutaredoxin family protein [Thiohalocapsa marina]
MPGAGQRQRKQVTLYSAPSCAHCRRAKAFMRARGIAFRELDVSRSSRARKELERMGARGVPVILIGGERLEGFSEQRFLRLYGAG